MEGGRGVGETEKHDQGFKQALIGREGSLPFVSILDPNIVVTPSYIKLGKIPGSFESSYNVGYQGEGIPVLYSYLVQLPIVLDKPQFTILLLDEKDGG